MPSKRSRSAIAVQDDEVSRRVGVDEDDDDDESSRRDGLPWVLFPTLVRPAATVAWNLLSVYLDWSWSCWL